MELQQLRYVLAVAKTGNFSRAAEQCHVAQPSLSQQIRKLEDELGERLFTRLRQRAVPTAAGESLVTRAARILAEVDAARRELHEASDLTRGTVAVGVLPTIAPYLLPRVLRTFSAAHPGLSLSVQEDITPQLVKLVGACELDLAILSLPLGDARLEHEELFTEELRLALPPGHPLAGRRRLSLDDLDGERFILMKEGHCLGDQALRFCQRHELEPQVVFRSAQLETIQALVLAGVGVSLMPEMACRSERSQHPVYRSLAAPRPSRVIAAVWRREQHHSRPAWAFLEHLRAAAKAMQAVPSRRAEG